MPAIQKGTMRFCELVNIHLEMRGKVFDIVFFKIDETGLFAAGAAAMAAKGIHTGEEKRSGHTPQSHTASFHVWPCDL
jgi:hypothetical protein